jgi:hypothetical protein
LPAEGRRPGDLQGGAGTRAYGSPRRWPRFLVAAGLLAAFAAPAGADFVELSPVTFLGAEQITGFPNPPFYVGSAPEVGFGSPVTQIHSTATFATFDLSQVPGTITGLELDVTVPIMVGYLNKTYSFGQGVSLSVSVTHPASTNPSDGGGVYTSVANGTPLTGFRVSETWPFPVPNTFALDLSQLVGTVPNGPLALGLVGTGATPFIPGALSQGLTAQLGVTFVPEPASGTLMGLGLALLLGSAGIAGRVGRRRRPRRAEPGGVG